MSDAAVTRRPDERVPMPDLAEAEATIRRAIDTRRPGMLPIIGNGEMSIALRWGEGPSTCVLKRVPPVSNPGSAGRYVELVQGHIKELEDLGVRCVATELGTTPGLRGARVTFHCQPLLDARSLADQILRRDEPAADHPVLIGVLDATVRAYTGGVPLDAQFANWFWCDDEAWHLDFSTPLLIDEQGDIAFDPSGFLREYPAPLRRTVYKQIMELARQYKEIDFILTDVMAQLFRQSLERWCEPFAAAAKERHGVDLSIDNARERYEADEKFFPTLLKLKRLQRAWVQRTGRTYDGLLPVTTSFGR